MLNKYQQLEQLLIAQAQALPLPSAIIIDPNEQSKEPMWFKMHHIIGNKDSVTLGSNGEDELLGILQIDCNMQKTGSRMELIKYAGEIVDSFPAGKSVRYNSKIASATNVRVTFRASYMSPIREVGDVLRISCTINYYTRFTRNTI